MSDHSRGWASVTLGDVALEVRNGISAKPDGGSGTRILRISAVRPMALDTSDVRFLEGTSAPWERYRLVPDDLLFTRYNGNPSLVGVCARVKEASGPATVYPDKLIRVRLAEQLAMPAFVEKAVHVGESRAFIDGKTKTSAGQVGISGADLKDVPLRLPPLPEQRRIVAKLESLQSRSRRAREALDAVPPLLEKLRQSILAAAFRGDLTKDWRAKHKDVEPASELLKRIRVERRRKWEEAELAKMTAKGRAPGDDRWKGKYKEPEAVDEAGLPELPWGWCWAPVPLLLSTSRVGMRTGPFGSLLGRLDYVAKGVPIVGVENIGRMSFVRVEKQHVTPSKAASLSEYGIEAGDLLISRSGTVGEVCVVPDDAGAGIISTNTIRVCMDAEVVEPFHLGFALIGASPVLAQIHDLCSGSTRDFLNQSIISELRVPLPPLAEQRQLVANVSQALRHCDDLARSRVAASTDLGSLDRSLLAKAFRGELVPQDPNDEPAEAMLSPVRRASDPQHKEPARGRARRVAAR